MPTKFTPECITQIKSLVQSGKTRTEIAQAIGVPLGSLAVTCSKLGISLRPPAPTNGAANIKAIAVVLRYKGQERTSPVPLPQEMIGRVVFEAMWRNMNLGEFIASLIRDSSIQEQA